MVAVAVDDVVRDCESIDKQERAFQRVLKEGHDNAKESNRQREREKQELCGLGGSQEPREMRDPRTSRDVVGA